MIYLIINYSKLNMSKYVVVRDIVGSQEVTQKCIEIRLCDFDAKSDIISLPYKCAGHVDDSVESDYSQRLQKFES
jgi:hypothetical protein